MKKLLVTTAVVAMMATGAIAKQTAKEKVQEVAEGHGYTVVIEDKMKTIIADLISDAELRGASLAFEISVLKIVELAAENGFNLDPGEYGYDDIENMINQIVVIAKTQIGLLNQQILALQSEVDVKAGVIEDQNEFILSQWEEVDSLNAEISILEADIVAYQQAANQATLYYNNWQAAEAKLDAVLDLDKNDYDVTINFGKGGNQIRFLIDGSYIGEAFKWKEKSGDLVETNDDAKNSIIDALEDAYAEGYKDGITDAQDEAE